MKLPEKMYMVPMAVNNLLQFECTGDAAHVVNREYLPKKKPLSDISVV